MKSIIQSPATYIKNKPLYDYLSKKENLVHSVSLIYEYVKEIDGGGSSSKELENRVSVVEDAVSALNGDGEGSVKSTVDSAISNVVANAPESLDTLKEIADWIVDHPEDTAEMNSRILQNTEAILGKQDKIEDLQDIRLGASLGSTALQSESDPTVPNWAKQPNKPTYTAQEVGALPSDTPLFSGDYNDLENKPTIPTVPTKVSVFDNDAGYLTEHQDISGLVDGGAYNSQTKKIELKHGSTVLAEIDAALFIVDGMVEDVHIENGHLVIDFNTASGKQPIAIPLTDIFDPNNYYTKQQTDALLSEKASTATVRELQQQMESKQDAIQDLDEIRAGADLGKTALQVENDPTVPEWAKQAQKPTYTAQEVGALPDDTVIPQMPDLSGYALKTDVDSVVADLQTQVDGISDIFRVKQFQSSDYNITIPSCQEDVENTAINRMDFSIDEEEGADYQIVGMIAYEFFDADGKRINCWPVCQFTLNGQKTLGVRLMCGGTQRKTVTRCSCWILLKHR